MKKLTPNLLFMASILGIDTLWKNQNKKIFLGG